MTKAFYHQFKFQEFEEKTSQSENILFMQF
jgi:hypothetical protein